MDKMKKECKCKSGSCKKELPELLPCPLCGGHLELSIDSTCNVPYNKLVNINSKAHCHTCGMTFNHELRMASNLEDVISKFISILNSRV